MYTYSDPGFRHEEFHEVKLYPYTGFPLCQLALPISDLNKRYLKVNYL